MGLGQGGHGEKKKKGRENALKRIKECPMVAKKKHFFTIFFSLPSLFVFFFWFFLIFFFWLKGLAGLALAVARMMRFEVGMKNEVVVLAIGRCHQSHDFHFSFIRFTNPLSKKKVNGCAGPDF